MKKVVVECNPDEILVSVLGLSRKEIAHQNNKGEVCNYMARSDVKVGIVDEDPGSGQPHYFQKFKVLEEKFGVIKMAHLHQEKTLLILRPRLEEWILMQCQQSRVNPETFYLPNNAKSLKNRINLKLDSFKKLLQELKKSNNKGLDYLQKSIEACNP